MSDAVVSRISAAGLDLIKQHEGLSLQAYADPGTGAEPWTIGYGHTGGIKRGDIITIDEAERLLAQDVHWAEQAVTQAVTVPLTPGQFDALVSLVFNIGRPAFASSTLLRKLNAADYAGAAAEFSRWKHAGGKELAGLVKRRAAEAALFMGAAPVPLHAAAAPQDTPPPAPPARKEPDAMPLPAFIAAALPALVQAIPTLGRLFGSGSQVAERNTRAAELAVQIVQQAVAAPNAQAAVETLAADPAAVKTAADAIASRWLDLTEAGGGIEEARKADAAAVASGGMLHSPSFWVAVLLLPLVYLLVGSLIGLVGSATWSDDVRAGLAGSIISAIIGGLIGYYYGQTTSRNRTPG